MKPWKLFLIYVLSLGCLMLFFRHVDWGDVWDTLQRISILYPLAFALGVFLNYQIRGLRWGILLKPFGKVPMRSRYNYTVIGFLVSYLLPGRLGEVARPLLLAQKERLGKAEVLATALFERLTDAGFILLVFIASMAFFPASAAPQIASMKRVAFWAMAGLILVFVLVFILLQKRFQPSVGRMAEKICRLLPFRFRDRVAEAIVSFLKALRPEWSLPDALRFTGLTLGLWGTVILFYWILSRGFPGIRLGAAGIMVFFAFIFFSAAIPTPGMAGSLDLASRFVLTGLLAVAENQAIAFTMLFHFLLIFTTVLLGLLALWQEGLSFNRIRLAGDKNEMS